MTGKRSAAIAKLTPKPIRYIVNTDWHGDHSDDVFVRYGFPFIDLAPGGSVAGMIAGLDRVLVKRILRKHGYPPDMAERATQTALEQAEVSSEGWAVA